MHVGVGKKTCTTGACASLERVGVGMNEGGDGLGKGDWEDEGRDFVSFVLDVDVGFIADLFPKLHFDLIPCASCLPQCL